uniref:DUF4283 domain-containing protein n=1 Tax=Tanacetum cinerariifolium TaxID=118510 RepID=A0A699HJG4_TANCI|nr:hypothetical protein [Tanacetum cinerariifolium]
MRSNLASRGVSLFYPLCLMQRGGGYLGPLLNLLSSCAISLREVSCGMERGFLSQKGSGVGKGVKEKDLNVVNLKTDNDGVIPPITVVGDTSTILEVTPSMIDMTGEKDKLSSLKDITVLDSYSPLPTHVTTSAGNAPGKSLYANITGKPGRKKVNVRTLFTLGGNGIDVVNPVDSILTISERFTNKAYGFFLRKKVAYPVVANYVRNTYGKYGLIRSMFSLSTGLFSFQLCFIDGLDAMLENGPCEDGLSAIASKLGTLLMLESYTSDMCMQSWGREGHYTCNVRVEYEWKPPRCSSCKVFGHIHKECPKNTSADEKKTVKMPSQTSRGVLVGPKIGFKPQKEYLHVPQKLNDSSSGNKKKGVEPTIEVSNLNSFDAINSVDNDAEFGINGETTNLVNNKATSSGSSFMNIDNDGEFTSNTPIGEKIDKIERQIGEGKLRLLDNDGNPLVPTGIVKSDSEMDVVFDETTNLRILTSGKDESDKGYGTNSLLEQ